MILKCPYDFEVRSLSGSLLHIIDIRTIIPSSTLNLQLFLNSQLFFFSFELPTVFFSFELPTVVPSSNCFFVVDHLKKLILHSISTKISH